VSFLHLCLPLRCTVYSNEQRHPGLAVHRTMYIGQVRKLHTHAHTHTHTQYWDHTKLAKYIYIYLCIYIDENQNYIQGREGGRVLLHLLPEKNFDTLPFVLDIVLFMIHRCDSNREQKYFSKYARH